MNNLKPIICVTSIGAICLKDCYITNYNEFKELHSVNNEFQYLYISGVAGAVDHGNHYSLNLVYEHILERSAFNMVCGPFGKVKGTKQDQTCFIRHFFFYSKNINKNIYNNYK